MIDINGDDNLVGTQWVGFVASNEDPLFEGRCKIRVYGKFDDMSLEELPWARPAAYASGGSASGSGAFSVPKVGSIVRITFEMGQIYAPIWHYNLYPSDELKEEIQGSYQNAHSLIYDTEAAPGPIKVFFTQEKGLMIDYNGSQVNIRPDKTVYIENSGGKIVHVQQDRISLGKEGESDEPATLGEKNVDALNALADEISNLALALQTFTTAQSAITTSIFTYAPLTPALTALSTAMNPIISKIQGSIKGTTIPNTRSSTVSLDGPPL